MLGTDRTTTSDATGRYTLAELTPGSVTLRLRKPDFVDAFFAYDDLRPPSNGYSVRADLDYPIQAGNEETIAVGTTAHGTVRAAFTSQPLAPVPPPRHEPDEMVIGRSFVAPRTRGAQAAGRSDDLMGRAHWESRWTGPFAGNRA